MHIEKERIEDVKTWPEPKLARDIKMFNGFANFYRRFFQAFSRIATSLTSMLRTTSSTSLATSVRAPIVVDDEIGIGGGGEIGKTTKSNESKNTKENTAGPSLLSSDARLAFTEAPILCYFNSLSFLEG